MLSTPVPTPVSTPVSTPVPTPVTSLAVSPDWLLLTKDWVNVIFWVINIAFLITTAVIGFLTFRAAKKTVLQPIKTEIFKEQIKEFSRILEYFNGKSESELRDDIVLNKLFHANVIAMFDRFAMVFYDYKINRDERPYNTEECPSSIITKEGMEKHFTLVNEYKKSEEIKVEKSTPDPRVRAALWADYECFMIHIPREYSEKLRELTLIKSSPLLTKKCVELIEEYEKALSYNLKQLRIILTNCAKELPTKYPTFDALSESSTSWIWSQYNRKLKSLKDPSEKLINYLRNYYNVDEILNIS